MASIVVSGDTSGSITLSAPAVAGSSVLTLPAVTDTVAGIAATQTLTNKTLTSPTIATPTMTGQATIPTINLTGGQITFPATQSASADANTLDDYEEGTWTPTNIGGSLVVVGTFSSSGTYTKIGKVVTVSGALNGTTSVAITGGGNVVCGGLPFSAAATLFAGSAVNAAANATASLYANSNTSVGSVTAMSATASIFFSITYFV